VSSKLRCGLLWVAWYPIFDGVNPEHVQVNPMREVPIRLSSHESVISDVVIAVGVRCPAGSRMPEFDTTAQRWESPLH
jgi:hypothetical protein